MKSLINAVAIALAVAAPVASFAQSSEPVTRAQVRADLVQVEAAGYRPAVGTDPNYPRDVQAAEARAAAQKDVAQADASGYGSATNGTSQAGQRADIALSSYSPSIHIHR